jgi:hypothetical protein
MIMTNKLVPVALVAALIGGSVGAFVMHSKNQAAQVSVVPQTAQSTLPGTDAQNAQYQETASGREQIIPAEFNTASEQSAYKSGFGEGFRACDSVAAANGVNTSSLASSQPRLVYPNTGRNYAHSSQSSTRVYSATQRPQGRSFWTKHRDKLTVAMGTGGGALIGGLIGGKKGAAIGALSGAGGSALYTYKLRKRNRRY